MQVAILASQSWYTSQWILPLFVTWIGVRLSLLNSKPSVYRWTSLAIAAPDHARVNNIYNRYDKLNSKIACSKIFRKRSDYQCSMRNKIGIVTFLSNEQFFSYQSQEKLKIFTSTQIINRMERKIYSKKLANILQSLGIPFIWGHLMIKTNILS